MTNRLPPPRQVTSIQDSDERPLRSYREGLEQLASVIIAQDSQRLELILRRRVNAEAEDDESSANLFGEFQKRSGAEV